MNIAVADILFDFRHHWHPLAPLSALDVIKQHATLAAELTHPLLVEAFWLCSKYGRRFVSPRGGFPTTVEAFLHDFPDVDRSTELMLDLIAVELSHADCLPELDDLVQRFPKLERELPALIATRQTIMDRVKLARLPGSNPNTRTYAGPGKKFTEFTPHEILPLSDQFQLINALSEPGLSGEKWVWVAQQESTGRQVVLKMPQYADELPRQSLVEEAKVIASLEHQNIPPVFAVRQGGPDEPAFAERLIVGCDWRQRIEEQQEQRRAISPDQQAARLRLEREHLAFNLNVLLKVCDALALAHLTKGIIHRDIKPANVMIGLTDGKFYGEVFLTDWGLATTIGTPTDGRGSMGYAAPETYPPPMLSSTDATEVKAIRVPQTAATDVFMLGATAYHILCGSSPFSTEHPSNTSPLIKPALNELMTELPRELWRIIARACSPDAESRYADAREFSAAITAYQQVATALDIVRAAEAELADVEAKAESGSALPRRDRMALIPVLQGLADRFHTAAQSWTATGNEASESLANVRRLEIRTRTRLASLAESLGDYGTAEHEYGRTLTASSSAPASPDVTRVRRRARMRTAWLWTGVATLLLAIIAGLVALQQSEQRVETQQQLTTTAQKLAASAQERSAELRRYLISELEATGTVIQISEITGRYDRLAKTYEALLEHSGGIDWNPSDYAETIIHARCELGLAELSLQRLDSTRQLDHAKRMEELAQQALALKPDDDIASLLQAQAQRYQFDAHIVMNPLGSTEETDALLRKFKPVFEKLSPKYPDDFQWQLERAGVPAREFHVGFLRANLKPGPVAEIQAKFAPLVSKANEAQAAYRQVLHAFHAHERAPSVASSIAYAGMMEGMARSRAGDDIGAEKNFEATLTELKSYNGVELHGIIWKRLMGEAHGQLADILELLQKNEEAISHRREQESYMSSVFKEGGGAPQALFSWGLFVAKAAARGDTAAAQLVAEIRQRLLDMGVREENLALLDLAKRAVDLKAVLDEMRKLSYDWMPEIQAAKRDAPPDSPDGMIRKAGTLLSALVKAYLGKDLAKGDKYFDEFMKWKQLLIINGTASEVLKELQPAFRLAELQRLYNQPQPQARQ